MNKYEVLYILVNSIPDENKNALVDKFSALVTSMGGNVLTVDKWGTRKFAYPINYKSEGYYVLMNFEADGAVPAEVERQMRISDEIIRYMVVRK